MAEEGVPVSAADVDPLLNEPDVPVAFAADGLDSETVARLKAIITTELGPELEAAIQVRRRSRPAALFCQSFSARNARWPACLGRERRRCVSLRGGG